MTALADETRTQVLAFRLSEDSWAQIILAGNVTQSGIRRLINILEIEMGAFPEQASSMEAE